MLRLDKFLADMAIGTRSDLKVKIKKGMASVNGTVVRQPEFKVNPDKDLVMWQGVAVSYQSYVYYMLNKPSGVVTATQDNLHKTVMDLICDKARKDLFPVGRLDKDTEGLLLITNDGALAHELLAPKKHVSKTYEAKIRGEVTQEDVRLFAEGLQVDDDWRALPAKLEVLNTVRIEKNEKTEAFVLSTVLVTICEGKFHQVKRMFEAVGKEVVFLKRLCMGPLRLDEDLAVGAYRLLSEEEISSLKNLRMG